jgi:hypothetical protein
MNFPKVSRKNIGGLQTKFFVDVCANPIPNAFRKQSAKSCGKNGHEHFYAEGSGYYRLLDRSRSAVVYENMRRICPQHFTANFQEKSVEHRKNNGLVSNLAEAELTGTEEQHLSTNRHRIAAKEQFSVIDLAEQLIPEQVPSSFEGEKKRIYVNAYERKQEARKLCIQAKGYWCRVCDMTFEQEFGDIGKGYIHVHHISPLSTSSARNTHPINDLCPVCPNCHAMLHRGESVIGRPYSVEELRDLRRKARRRVAARLRRKKRSRAN